MARKSQAQAAAFVAELLGRHLPPPQAQSLAVELSEGRWTHDFPITVDAARRMGLPVSTSMPRLVYELMDLYPQADARRTPVIYVPDGTEGGRPDKDTKHGRRTMERIQSRWSMR